MGGGQPGKHQRAAVPMPARGALGQQRGRKADPQTAELKRLQRENERLRSRLERAEHIIEVQKKLAELLGTSLNEIPSNEQR